MPALPFGPSGLSRWALGLRLFRAAPVGGRICQVEVRPLPAEVGRLSFLLSFSIRALGSRGTRPPKHHHTGEQTKLCVGPAAGPGALIALPVVLKFGAFAKEPYAQSCAIQQEGHFVSQNMKVHGDQKR